MVAPVGVTSLQLLTVALGLAEAARGAAHASPQHTPHVGGAVAFGRRIQEGGGPQRPVGLHAQRAQRCLAGGDETSINAALAAGGAGAQVALCPGSSFALRAPVAFTAAGQSLFTQGLPTGDARALLRVTGSQQTVAVRGDCGSCNEVALRNVRVDGNRPALGRRDPGGALLEFGGPTSGQVIDSVHAYEPRAWSTLHVIEGLLNCRDAQVTNNLIGPAGHYTNAEWADGISMACTNSLVENNTIVDATDGAVVLFGAPGTVVRNNHVLTRERILLGAFNLVDYGPYAGNNVGLVVENNRIEAHGGYIKTGVAVGPATWGEDTTAYVRGPTVRNNLFVGDNMGYGIVVNGAQDVTVAGNRAQGTFSGRLAEGCLLPLNAPPAPFVYSPERTTGTLQKGFVRGRLQYVICVQPGRPTQQAYTLGQFALDPGESLQLSSARLRLTHAGAIEVVAANGRRLWQLATHRACASGCRLDVDAAGRLRLRAGAYVSHWPTFSRGAGAGAVLTVADAPPYLALRSGAGDLVWASSYLLPALHLTRGRFVAREVGQTTYYLRLEDDANLRVRRRGLGGKVVWSSAVDGARCGNDCFTALQEDGNLVTYVGGRAVWASGTNDASYTVAGVLLQGEAPYLQVQDTRGRTRWRS